MIFSQNGRFQRCWQRRRAQLAKSTVPSLCRVVLDFFKNLIKAQVVHGKTSRFSNENLCLIFFSLLFTLCFQFPLHDATLNCKASKYCSKIRSSSCPVSLTNGARYGKMLDLRKLRWSDLDQLDI